MVELSLTVLKAKVLKDGRHKIRVAIRKDSKACYIVTPYTIESINQWKNGKVVRNAEAADINLHLRLLLNEYQKKVNHGICR